MVRLGAGIHGVCSLDLSHRAMSIGHLAAQGEPYESSDSQFAALLGDSASLPASSMRGGVLTYQNLSRLRIQGVVLEHSPTFRPLTRGQQYHSCHHNVLFIQRDRLRCRCGNQKRVANPGGWAGWRPLLENTQRPVTRPAVNPN